MNILVHYSNETVKNREVEGLVEAMDTYGLQEGFILTENDQKTIKTDKHRIKIVPICRWLLDFPRN